MDNAPKETLHQINNSEHLGGQERVMRVILDHLLPKCCLGDQASHFEMQTRLSSFTWGPQLTLTQNDFHINILEH